jgi:hypothetical protein
VLNRDRFQSQIIRLEFRSIKSISGGFTLVDDFLVIFFSLSIHFEVDRLVIFEVVVIFGRVVVVVVVVIVVVAGAIQVDISIT